MTYEKRVKELFRQPLIGDGINNLIPADKATLKQTNSINWLLAETILLENTNLPLVEALEATTRTATTAAAIGSSLTAYESRQLVQKFIDLGFTQKEINAIL